MLATLIRIALWPYMFPARIFFGKNRIRSLQTPPLGIARADVERVFGIYGEDENKDGRVILYYYGLFHLVRVNFDKTGFSRGYVFISTHPDPIDDLNTIMERYGGGHAWVAIEEGYSYKTKNGAIQLSCSAASMIGVRQIIDNSAQQGDAPEPATIADSASPSSQPPAR